MNQKILLDYLLMHLSCCFNIRSLPKVSFEMLHILKGADWRLTEESRILKENNICFRCKGVARAEEQGVLNLAKEWIRHSTLDQKRVNVPQSIAGIIFQFVKVSGRNLTDGPCSEISLVKVSVASPADEAIRFRVLHSVHWTWPELLLFSKNVYCCYQNWERELVIM